MRGRFLQEHSFELNPYTPNTEIQQLAAQFTEQQGFPPYPITRYAKLDKARATQIAEAYADTPSCPGCADVREAYRALVREVEQQWDAVQELGINIEPYGDDMAEPYANSPELMEDIFKNRHMWVYAGGEDHDILTHEQDWKFRAVHDLFGHAAHGYSFGPRGEENAWISHSKMFSPQARAALTSETRGQNSWVNFGPFSDLPVGERPFAEQKSILLPYEYQVHSVLLEVYRDFPDFYPPVGAPAVSTMANPAENFPENYPYAYSANPRVNLGDTRCQWGEFQPDGRVQVHSPIEGLEDGTLSALIIVGLDVRDGGRFKMDDVVAETARIRIAQMGDSAASFMWQTGIWRSATGEIVQEDAVRIIIIDRSGSSRAAFERDMEGLAEGLRAAFNQEAVVIDFQERGVTFAVKVAVDDYGGI